MLRSLRLHRRPRLGATIAILAASFAVAATAEAASSISSISVANGELVVDKEAAVSASGLMDPIDSENFRGLWLHVNPATMPCLATGALNRPRSIATDLTDVLPGPFQDAQTTWRPDSAGSFLLCTYLEEYHPGVATFATGQLAVTVRQPNSTLSLALPGSRFEAGETVPMEVTAYAEVRRKFDFAVNPIGIPCGTSVDTNPTGRIGIGAEILGGPATLTAQVELPSKAGHWRLCGWIGRGEWDGAPTSRVGDVTFWTGPEPSCRVGAAPATPTGRVRVWCVSVEGTVNLEARRGRRVFNTDVLLANGAGTVNGRKLGLKRGSRVSVLVGQDDARLGSRVLRVRAKR